MNRIRFSLVTLALMAFASGSALADPYYHHHHGGGVHFGISVGVPMYYGPRYYAPYYYPRYYYPPAYAVAPVVVSPPIVSAPPVYIEQPQAPAAAVPGAVQPQANSPYWYYCAASQAYYPYVKNCASGWQQVTPQAPEQ